VLHQDEKNVYTLANLAAIQVELGAWTRPEASPSGPNARAHRPYISPSWAISGFKQQKYDEALDALSRAAKLEPENARFRITLA